MDDEKAEMLSVIKALYERYCHHPNWQWEVPCECDVRAKEILERHGVKYVADSEGEADGQ